MYQTAAVGLISEGVPLCRRFALAGALPQASATISKRCLTTALIGSQNGPNPSPKAHARRTAERRFSFSPNTQRSEDFFPASNTDNIRITRPAWPHPIYTEAQMAKIQVAHREAKNWSDWVALGAVRILRWGLDLATGYKHNKEVAKAKMAPGTGPPKFAMNEKKYLIR